MPRALDEPAARPRTEWRAGAALVGAALLLFIIDLQLARPDFTYRGPFHAAVGLGAAAAGLILPGRRPATIGFTALALGGSLAGNWYAANTPAVMAWFAALLALAVGVALLFLSPQGRRIRPWGLGLVAASGAFHLALWRFGDYYTSYPVL